MSVQILGVIKEAITLKMTDAISNNFSEKKKKKQKKKKQKKKTKTKQNKKNNNKNFKLSLKAWGSFYVLFFFLPSSFHLLNWQNTIYMCISFLLVLKVRSHGNLALE